MKSGVYIIKNLINNKVYVGSASNFQRRFYLHKRELNNNNHHSNHLQKSWNKYGSSNFEFIILENTECVKDVLLQTEQKYIDLYKSSNRKYGYNINPNAESSLGVKRSDEYKRKSSESRKGKISGDKNPMFGKSVYSVWVEKYGIEEADKMQKEANKKNSDSNKGKGKGEKNLIISALNKQKTRPVLQYDLNNTFIKEWNSITEAADYLKTTPKTIRKICLSGDAKKHNFIWKYKTENDKIKRNPNFYPKNSKKIIQINKNGEIINNFESLSEAESILNINRKKIKSFCEKGLLINNNFKLKYE